VTEGLSDNKSESFEHLRIKRFLLENLPENNDIKEIKEEITLGNRIADVYVRLASGKEVVIEIQHSKIIEEDLIRRTRDYTDMGYHALWLLDGTSHERYPRIDEVFASKAELFLHRIYKGRVYFLNASKLEGITSSVYPLHYTFLQEVRKARNGGYSYFRRSPTSRSVVPGTVPSLELTVFKNRGFKLARFTDQNVKDQCLMSISNVLKDQDEILEALKEFGKDLPPKEKLLTFLMSEFQPKFGFHLIYNILRQLKAIEKKDFSYLLKVHKHLRKPQIQLVK
jgi:competence CoiA-like predicted nuclease